MTEVIFEGDTIALHQGETVLEGLERTGHKIPNSCRQGLCHACMMHSSDPAPSQSQDGLSDLQREQGLFLSCCCYPDRPMQVALALKAELVPARVLAKEWLSDSVLGLSLTADLRWQPGQHILLWKDEWTARPYSIASHPDRDGELAMHILRHAHGEVSNWCHDELQVGQTLNISRPQGHCVYMAEDLQQPLLMVATGTGLAPIYGILHDALARGHSGPIDLYVEAGSDAECYLHSQLHQLMQLHPQFAYHPLIRPTADDTAFDSEMISRFSKRHPSLRGTKVYLCGSADMIALLNRQCFMAGAGRSDILTEPFSAPLKNN